MVRKPQDQTLPFSEDDSVARLVLASYGIREVSGWESLGGAGGFSGAAFWRFRATQGEPLLCLRRWPSSHPSEERLVWIHAVLRHVFQGGVTCLPVPRELPNGGTFHLQSGHLWELSDWLDGEADFQVQPTLPKLSAAMETLALFHRAAATFPGKLRGGVRRPARNNVVPQQDQRPSPGLLERRNALVRWLRRDLARMNDDLTNADGPVEHGASVPRGWSDAARRQLAKQGRELVRLSRELGPRWLLRLDESIHWHVPLQPCIRDVRDSHVLFCGEAVSGIVDFGAMREETVAGDLGRLLGSLVADDVEAQEFALLAYERVRPLTRAERDLVNLFDLTGVLLGGLNWLRWLFWEERSFHAPAVLERIDQSLIRLHHHAG